LAGKNGCRGQRILDFDLVIDYDAAFSFEAQELVLLTEIPISRALSLDEEVEQTYAQTKNAIGTYLLCLGVPRSQVQEVTQEVYLRFYQTRRKGQDIQNLRAWLFRVAHNLGLKVRSRERSFRAISPDWERLIHPAADSPERVLLDRERMARIAAALSTLSPQQRNCLYLRSEGLRYREIAEVIGVSSSTVNEFLRRAIARLAEAVNE
jgi:RNA polymerase sigma-70 factor (ECF subfamily)